MVGRWPAEMKLLLDTHAVVWWLTDSPKLTHGARSAIASPTNDVYVSAASGWEIATKVRRGRWPEAAPLLVGLHALLAENRIAVLPIELGHAVRAGTLDGAHNDPFDRIIAAQALEQDELTLVTVDPVFGDFGVKTLW